MLTEEIMYNALLQKDTTFEGVFFAGVKTTGIFCRPTCSARKPKKENVQFFNSCKEAMQHGFRPCKICTPLENPCETPEWIKRILREIDTNPALRLNDQMLRVKGIEPSKIRRWFKKNHGITFHAYQRMQRINNAFGRIAEGQSVLSAAFDSGYESLSGFSESYKSIIGTAPINSRNRRVIILSRLDTPLGPMFAGAVHEGICLLEFTDRRMLETELKQLTRLLDASIIQGSHPHIENLKQQLKEYFAGARRNFAVPLFAPGTDFQKLAWAELIKVPYGTTRSYKAQAISLSIPNSVRAVASANGHNRISIVIPCHRIIGENGHLTGYGGGLWRKQWLIDFEKQWS